MKLLDMSDAEIKDFADPIRQDVIDGSNNKDWELHSRNLPLRIIKDEDIQRDVEKQWRDDESASSPRTSLARESEYLGVVRKNDIVAVLWKQTSTLSNDEYLLKILLKELDGEIKQAGALLD